MAKFVSKTSNLCIILRPGIQAQPLTGTPATPTIYVRFQDGRADVIDKKLEEMMFNHPGYQRDFFVIEEGDLDPFARKRIPSEPAHIITEMKYGHPVKRIDTNPATQFPPEIMNMVKDMAVKIGAELATQAIPGMVEEQVKAALASGGYQKIVSNEEGEVTVTPADETQIKPKTKSKK